MPEDHPTPEWRPIPSHPGYEAGSGGTIRNALTGRELVGSPNHAGYLRVMLPGRVSRSVHRLVAATFYGPSNLPVNHRDGNRTNNAPSNLEYVTPRENQVDAVRRRGSWGSAAAKAVEHSKKTHCPRGHAYDKENTLVNRRGSRVCRMCLNLKGQAKFSRRRASEAPIRKYRRCARCGMVRGWHCDLDEPGLDHPSDCRKRHHEFIPMPDADRRKADHPVETPKKRKRA